MKLLNKTETIYPHNYITESNKSFSRRKFNWTPSNIKWFLDAEKSTDFYDEAIKIMEPYIINSKTVIDIGCGIGTFSIKLAMKGFNITAVDISHLVIKTLEKRINNYSLQNIRTLNTAFEFILEKERYDIVLMSYVMGLINESNIEKIINLSNNYTILILPVDEIKDNFSITELYKRIKIDVRRLKQPTYKELIKVFEGLKIDYDLKIFQSDFGQPFDSKEEAIKFIQYYFKIPESKKVELIKWIEEKLIRKNSKYYLPNKKKSAVVIIKK